MDGIVWKHTPGKYTTDFFGFDVEVVSIYERAWYVSDGVTQGSPIFKSAKAAMAFAEEYYA